jgi:hypothetical protein
MGKREFLEAVREFMEILVGGVSFRAHLAEREDWMGTPESDRERCLQALDAVRAAWNQSPQDLARLQEMTLRSLRHYELGEIDAGDCGVRDIDEFISGVRERAT